MAIKEMRRRLGRMERRFLVESPKPPSDSHNGMARDLALARLILDAEREAIRLLSSVRDRARNGRCWGDTPEIIAESIAKHQQSVSVLEIEIAGIERRCAEVGLTEEDIARLAS